LVTIERGDNDPRRLWGSMVAALARHTALPVSTSIPSPLGWSADEQTRFVTRLADELRLLPNSVRLVLDGLDQLADPAALHGLGTFLRDRPSQVHMVLASRFDPPLGLNQLRGSARLGEIRVDHLRFTLVESKILLDTAGLHLTPSHVERLHRRTGGRAAALRLAATAISDAPDPDRFIAEFSRDRRCAADYLTGKIIDHLPSDTAAFLRAISVADPISSKLATALSSRPDAGTLLNSLEHDTSLLSAVGWPRDTYRLQPLLRTYLLADLHRHPPQPAPTAHRSRPLAGG
jgi:LuxR family maltose regulon positive regulatory protein